MRQQILVPLDGSAQAESILPYAGALVRATSSTLKLLQVEPPTLVDMEVTGMTPMLEKWQKQALDAARAYLTGVAARLQSAGLAVQTEVLEGDPAACIVSSAEQDSDLLLIAMATHGRGGMHRWILGSVTSKVLHTCPRPLLLKRPSRATLPLPGEVTYHTIVVPLDGSPFAEGVLDQAQRFASAVGAALLLVSVVPPLDGTAPGTSGGAVPGDLPSQMRAAHRAEVESRGRYLEHKALQLREEAGLTVQTEVAGGHIARKIVGISSEKHGDVLVLAAQGRSDLECFWLGSVETQILLDAEQPVLLVPTRADGGRVLLGEEQWLPS